MTTEIPALRPTVDVPTMDRPKKTDAGSLVRARRRTSKSSQFDEIMPESKRQRLQHKHARENWKWFDGIPCTRCGSEIPPLNPHIATHGQYCSDLCYQLNGGHMRGLFERTFGVKY